MGLKIERNIFKMIVDEVIYNLSLALYECKRQLLENPEDVDLQKALLTYENAINLIKINTGKIENLNFIQREQLNDINNNMIKSIEDKSFLFRLDFSINKNMSLVSTQPFAANWFIKDEEDNDILIEETGYFLNNLTKRLNEKYKNNKNLGKT